MALVSENTAVGIIHKVPQKVKFFSGLAFQILLFGAILEVFSLLSIERFTAYKVNATKIG